VRTTGACKLFCISRQKFGQFLALVPDFASRVKFVADTRVKLNRLRDQQVEAAGERTKAMEGYEAAAVAEVLNQPNMRRCCSVVKRKWTMPTLAAAHATTLVSPRATLLRQCHALGPRGELLSPASRGEAVGALPAAPAHTVAYVVIQALHSSR
jgi:hypothetical protein